jgi:hypothetical protein
VPYLSSAAARATHSAEVFAAAGRAHLYEALNNATLETVQACCLLAMADWGCGELNRAWTLSCRSSVFPLASAHRLTLLATGLSIALAINLSLHINLRAEPDPNAIKLKTFHSTLILHTLLSLRLLRPPIIVLEDYDIPLPPVDGAENFELWRMDRTPEQLRAEHGVEPAQAPSFAPPPPPRSGHAVRSSALSTFSKMASLCAIGISIIRWGVCPRRGNGQGLAVGEQERQELVNSLAAWEHDLPSNLRISDQSRGVEKLADRSRHTIEMHMLLFTLYLRLTPHRYVSSSSPVAEGPFTHPFLNRSSFQSTFDPFPQARALLVHIITQSRELFTFYRALPTVEAPLHVLSCSLFLSTDYIPQQHDTPLFAYEELARVLPVAQTSYLALKSKVDEHRRELGLIRGESFPFADHSLFFFHMNA